MKNLFVFALMLMWSITSIAQVEKIELQFDTISQSERSDEVPGRIDFQGIEKRIKILNPINPVF